MRRRNPALTSSPNPQIDMTSFMDIIFIFLFVAMIGYALKCAEVSDEAKLQMSEAEQKLSEANEKMGKVSVLEADLYTYKLQNEALAESVLGKRVIIISISCSYDEGDSEHPEEWTRHLRALDTKQEELFRSDFNSKDGKVQRTFDQFKEKLSNYVDEVKKADKDSLGEFYGNDRQNHTIIVFSVDSKEAGILTRDRNEIMSIIEDLEKKYDDVY